MKPVPLAEFKAGIIPLEEEEQAAVVDWLRNVRPDIKYFAVPNGGARHPKTARMLKATGVQPGVPDLVFPTPCGPFHGGYLEMKRRKGGNLKDPDQLAWQDFLRGKCYAVGVAKGYDEAITWIVNYHGLGPFQPWKGNTK